MFFNHKQWMFTSLILCNAVYVNASNFNGSVIFGDSLSDGGNVGLVTLGQATKFTTNPGMTTAEIVADRIGHHTTASLLGGQNYAWGGATVSDLEKKVPNLQQQLGQYLSSNGGQANENTLYQVWGGGNDIFNLVSQFQTGSINLQQLQLSLMDTSNKEVLILDSLYNAGARYVVVYNLPDMGLTPDANASGPMVAGFMSQLSNSYNTQLNAELEKMSTKGLNIVPVNVYGLLGEINQNPYNYGIINNISDTACGGSSLGCTANGQGYMFADGVHPTSETHQLLAQVVLSTLAAPQQMSLLAELPLMARDSQKRVIRQEMLKDIKREDTHVFINTDYNHQKIKATPSNPELSTNDVNLNVGLNYRLSSQVSGGVGISLNQQKGDFGHQIGSYDLRSINGFLFGIYKENKNYLSSYANVGRLDYKDISRQIQIGPMQRVQTAETKGSQYGVGLEFGHVFDVYSNIKITPFTSLDWQKVRINGFEEKEADSTAMWFEDQNRESLTSSLGVRFQSDWKLNNYILSPALEASWSHEFKDDALAVKAGLKTMNGSFEMSGYKPEKDWFNVNVGLNAQLRNNFSSWFMVNARLANHSQENMGLSIGLKYLF